MLKNGSYELEGGSEDEEDDFISSEDEEEKYGEIAYQRQQEEIKQQNS